MPEDYESIFARVPSLLIRQADSTDDWLSRRHDIAHFATYHSLGPVPHHCEARWRFLWHHRSAIHSEQKAEDVLPDYHANEQRVN